MNKKHLYKKIIILFILLFLAESNNVVYADEYESDDVIEFVDKVPGTLTNPRLHIIS